MFKKIVFLGLSLLLVSCSFDKSSNTARDQRDKENLRAQAIFDSVKGLYRGKMTKGSREFYVELSLSYIVKTTNEKDENSQNIIRIVPRASLQVKSPARAPLIFDYDFTPSTGKLSLLSFSGGTSSADPGPSSPSANNTELSFTENSTAEAGEIESILSNIEFSKDDLGANARYVRGDIFNKAADLIGHIDLKYDANAVLSNEETQTKEYYRLLRQELLPLCGTYLGKSVLNGKSQEYILNIGLEDNGGNDLTAPKFYGSILRSDDKLGSGKLTLTFFAYSNDFNPPKLFMVGVSAYLGSNYRAEYEGFIADSVYTGSWKSIRGYEGSFVFKKIKSASLP